MDVTAQYDKQPPAILRRTPLLAVALSGRDAAPGPGAIPGARAAILCERAVHGCASDLRPASLRKICRASGSPRGIVSAGGENASAKRPDELTPQAKFGRAAGSGSLRNGGARSVICGHRLKACPTTRRAGRWPVTLSRRSADRAAARRLGGPARNLNAQSGGGLSRHIGKLATGAADQVGWRSIPAGRCDARAGHGRPAVRRLFLLGSAGGHRLKACATSRRRGSTGPPWRRGKWVQQGCGNGATKGRRPHKSGHSRTGFATRRLVAPEPVPNIIPQATSPHNQQQRARAPLARLLMNGLLSHSEREVWPSGEVPPRLALGRFAHSGRVAASDSICTDSLPVSPGRQTWPSGGVPPRAALGRFLRLGKVARICSAALPRAAVYLAKGWLPPRLALGRFSLDRAA